MGGAAALILALAIGLVCATAQAIETTCRDGALIASGEFKLGDHLVIRRELDRCGRGGLVLFRDSPGGNAHAGFETGRMLRERKVATAVSGLCFSACAIAFLGGVERSFASDRRPSETMLGFHPMRHRLSGVQDPQGAELMARYIRDMTDGRMTGRALDDAIRTARAESLLLVLHPSVSSILVDGAVRICLEPPGPGSDIRSCPPVTGVDALTLGVITSGRRIAVPG
jgi:hypothetical protein